MSINHVNYLALTLVSLVFMLHDKAVYAAAKEPINIEADNAKIIEKEGKSIYTGNVLLIQGNIRLTADKLIVKSSKGKLVQITAQGSPVTYSEKSSTPHTDISGEAEILEYYATDDRILLLNNAKLSQGGTTFGGNRIEYNTATDIVTAEVSNTGKERVQVTIQPDNTSKTPNPAPH